MNVNAENESRNSKNQQNSRHTFGSKPEYTIVINEVLANALNEDTGEFVELYNYGDDPINISDWYVKDPKDSNDRIKDYTGEFDRGLEGTVIPSKGFCLYVDSEYQGEYNHLLVNSNVTANMIMVTCDGDTTVGNGLTNSQDSITIDNEKGFTLTRGWSEDAGEGRSFGVIPDATGPWLVLDSPSPGYSNGKIPMIVINEIMYNPKGTEVDGEWIELYNADEITINITGWKISDSDKNSLVLPALEIPVDSYVVVHVGSSPG
ncbi:MAG: lamin tail domain-containing protein, partial [Thermoplasmata archaeon]